MLNDKLDQRRPEAPAMKNDELRERGDLVSMALLARRLRRASAAASMNQGNVAKDRRK